jgi:hypothetical protein
VKVVSNMYITSDLKDLGVHQMLSVSSQSKSQTGMSSSLDPESRGSASLASLSKALTTINKPIAIYGVLFLSPWKEFGATICFLEVVHTRCYII